jgi:hypothetical protein
VFFNPITQKAITIITPIPIIQGKNLLMFV